MYIVVFIVIIGVIAYRKGLFEKDRQIEEAIVSPHLDERINLLLEQLEKKEKSVKDEYTTPKGVSKVNFENLKTILESLLKHLDMDNELSLEYYPKEESDEKGISCGKIELVENKIILNQMAKYNIKDYEAEMIHLCVETFIEKNGFKNKSESDKAKDIDILAVLFGFGKHLHLYTEMSTAEQIISPYKASKLGYLSSIEMEHVQSKYDKLLLEKRERDEELKRAKETEERITNTRLKLKGRINSLRLDFEKNEDLIGEAVVADSNKVDKEDEKSLSELKSKYKEKKYEKELDELQIVYEDPEKKNEVIKKLDELDEKLRKDSFLISKYRS